MFVAASTRNSHERGAFVVVSVVVVAAAVAVAAVVVVVVVAAAAVVAVGELGQLTAESWPAPAEPVAAARLRGC